MFGDIVVFPPRIGEKEGQYVKDKSLKEGERVRRRKRKEKKKTRKNLC